ncbi:MAG: capsular biosynthesis protein [Desulfobulbus sp.]|nr:capsular biosynthesis protein [Desulfobulbus sp.]
MSRQRTFLLLQGVCSPFFYRLGQALRAAGHHVHKINFNAGDWFYWLGRSAWTFRGPSAELAPFLAEKYRNHAITDQVLFGDCRPIHRPAIEMAAKFGIRTHVIEEGYFRPYWVTIERDGVNGYSRLPKDPAWYRAMAKELPEYRQGQPFSSSFNIRAFHDVAYHLAGFYNPVFFPGYRTHTPVTAPAEYLGYIKRLPMLRFHRRRDDELLLAVLRKGIPYYLFPLQLSSDAQIRHHSTFADMTEAMEHIMQSFALHAPSNAALIIKNHPLDAGLDHYPTIIDRLTRQFALKSRIYYMETGDLPELLNHAAGTVTVNSTVGMTALARHCPTIALSKPIYNIPGLTFQGSLDSFWANKEKPIGRLFRVFRNTVIHTTQVNGGLYSNQGIEMLVANAVPRLEAERSPLEELL